MNEKITIQTQDGYYLTPGPINLLPLDLRQHGVVGSITLSSNPYSWNYTNGVISTNEGYAWDIYTDTENADYIILWEKVNNSTNQKFVVGDDNIRFGKKQVTLTNIARLVNYQPDHLKITKVSKTSDPIKFVQYNMLVADPGYENDFIDNIPSQYRRWNHPSGIRKQLVKNAIKDYDLITLNEVTPDMLQYVTPKTHQYIYCPRNGDFWGSAIVYDTNRFTVMNKLCRTLIPQTTQTVNSVLLWDNISETPVCVTSLHLKAGYQEDEAYRLKQIKISIQLVEQWLLKEAQINPREVAHVLAGDLNSDRLAYHSLVKDGLESQGFIDVFEGYKGDKYWTYNYWHRSIFDYIFIRGPIKAIDLYIPISQKISPNEEQGSDHIPIYCKFIL